MTVRLYFAALFCVLILFDPRNPMTHESHVIQRSVDRGRGLALAAGVLTAVGESESQFIVHRPRSHVSQKKRAALDGMGSGTLFCAMCHSKSLLLRAGDLG